MKKGLKVLVALVCLLGLLMVIPQEFQARKSIVINKSKSEIIAYVSDFKNYNQWNPWFKIDSNMTSTVEGKVYSWSSESEEVGTGSQTIVFASEDSIAHALKFTAPFESEANAYLTFKEVEGGTEVSWGFTSDGNVLIGLVADPGTMVGDKYTIGLASLKAKLEQ